MTTYSITAIITKIDSENKVTISGVGKHRYEKSKDEVYNILEENAEPESSKVLKQDTAFSIVKSGSVDSNTFASKDSILSNSIGSTSGIITLSREIVFIASIKHTFRINLYLVSFFSQSNDHCLHQKYQEQK